MELTRREAAARRALQDEQASPGGPFTILSVCTGNICRSPIAEQLLRTGLSDVPQMQVVSAGTMALPGDAMPEQAQALSTRLGGDPAHHAARRLTGEQISGARLVLAMAREHRSAIIRLVPRATRITFTVREFARLAGDVTAADLAIVDALPAEDVPGRLAAAVELIASRRGTVDHPAHPDDDDVIDPYRRDDATFDLSGEQLVPAVNAVVGLLRRAALSDATAGR